MDFYKSSKPGTRWWWFASEIAEKDIAFQLDWLKENGFGGVEIAWVYTLPDARPAPAWLSPEWSGKVAFAKEYCSKLGLFCDFTYGSLWPFGGSVVDESMASRDFDGLSKQRLRKTWEGGEHYILNHLSKKALDKYSNVLGKALPTSGEKSAYFCDSWEVAPEKLWNEGLDEEFEREFGYSIEPAKADLDLSPEIRYDYRKFVSKIVNREFYRPFTDISNKMNGFSRVQAHGSPTNLVDAYACADVPESEAVLFDPHFSQFAASAAALSGKNIVSSETFTCLYGWKGHPGPGQHQCEENVEDLRMLADALFANGVNMIFWHGFPYNPEGGHNTFYASVHVGLEGSLSKQLKPFNAYMEKASQLLRAGKSWFGCACYLPMEDNWMAGEVPQELRRPSAQYFWELHYQRFPDELLPYRPCWITGEFLKMAHVEDGWLVAGGIKVPFLYVDCEYLDFDSLKEITRLANDGLKVVLSREPEEPGFIQHENYGKMLDELYKKSNVAEAIGHPRVLESETKLEYWIRKDNGKYTIFIAHPASGSIKYPMEYNQSDMAKPTSVPVAIRLDGRTYEQRLDFRQNRPVIMTVSDRIEILEGI